MIPECYNSNRFQFIKMSVEKDQPSISHLMNTLALWPCGAEKGQFLWTTTTGKFPLKESPATETDVSYEQWQITHERVWGVQHIPMLCLHCFLLLFVFDLRLISIFSSVGLIGNSYFQKCQAAPLKYRLMKGVRYEITQ